MKEMRMRTEFAFGNPKGERPLGRLDLEES
jgi:hypothetical protein